MKTLTLAAIVTGLLVLPFLVLRRRDQEPATTEPEKLYDIDDYIDE